MIRVYYLFFIFICLHNISIAQTCTAISINCSPDITVQAGSGDCTALAQYSISLNGDCDLVSMSQVDNSGYSAGDLFPIGITEQSFISLDIQGNSDTCSFTVEVLEYQNPNSDLSCHGSINISPDDDCLMLITADMMLTGAQYGCADSYIVTVTTAAGQVIPNPITGDYIGMTLMISVMETTSGNSCWGYANVEDYIIPNLQCSAVESTCQSNYSPSQDPTATIQFPLPTGVNITEVSPQNYLVDGFDCSQITLSYLDTDVLLNCTLPGAYAKLIYRNWTAIDQSGNSTTCTDTIQILKPNLNALNLPPNRDDTDEPSLLCSGDWDANDDGIPQAEEIGDNFDENCFIWSDYSDYSNHAGCVKIITRNWQIMNMCTGAVFNHVQKIKIIDDLDPEISCPSLINTNTNYTNCAANFQVPHPNIYDACSQVTYTVQSTNGNVINYGTALAPHYVINDLPLGSNSITYTAIDACGNENSCTTIVNVADHIPPNVQCNQQIVLNPTLDNIATLYASQLDNNTWDNCQLSSIKIRRLERGLCLNMNNDDLTWKDYETFCCEENGLEIYVELGAWDIYGNFSSCISTVRIGNPNGIEITCPQDITVSCDFPIDMTDLSVFGTVHLNQNDREMILIEDDTYAIHCLGITDGKPIKSGFDGFVKGACVAGIDEQVESNLTCNKSAIINGVLQSAIDRIFTVTDVAGNTKTCTQRIYIVDCLDSDISITWPLNVQMSICNVGNMDPSQTGEPEVIDANCSGSSIAFYDVIDSTSLSCLFVNRHWTVTDTCNFDANGQLEMFSHIQQIEVLNAPVNVLSDCADTILIDAGTMTNTMELVVNGDFENFNVGFTSEYENIPSVAGGYIVGPKPNIFNGQHFAIDHTTGTGNMLIVDGSTTANEKVWCQEISVQNNTEYLFSAWVDNVTIGSQDHGDPNLAFSVNDIEIATSGRIPELPDGWKELTGTWFSGGNTNATLCAYSKSNISIGNDFVIDDISFRGSQTGTDCDSVNMDGDCLYQVDLNGLIIVQCGDSLDINWSIDFDYDGAFEADLIGMDEITALFPAGRHRVNWETRDACGAIYECSSLIIIECQQTLSAVCLGMYQINMPDSGNLVFQADYFDFGSTGCSTNLEFKILVDNQFPLQDSIELTCDDLTDTITYIPLHLYVIDGLDTSICEGELEIFKNDACVDVCELIYASGSDQNIYSINTSTLEIEQINTQTSGGINATAVNIDQGLVYHCLEQDVFWVDIRTGNTGIVGNAGTTGSLSSASADYYNGYLYLGPENGTGDAMDIFRVELSPDGKSIADDAVNLSNGIIPPFDFGDMILKDIPHSLGNEIIYLSMNDGFGNSVILEFDVAMQGVFELSSFNSSNTGQITLDQDGIYWYFDNGNMTLNEIDPETSLKMNTRSFNLPNGVVLTDLGRSWCGETNRITNRKEELDHVFVNQKNSNDELIQSEQRIAKEEKQLPFLLFQNSPNPFSYSTIINFQRPEAGITELLVYDQNGKLLINKKRKDKKGMSAFVIETQLASGLYFYQIKTEKHSATKKMIVF